MNGFAYCAALVVAAVFLRAGAAKLADREGTRRAFDAFGLPSAAATVVPVIELSLVIVLIVIPGWGAVLALALLTAFTTMLGLAVRAGVQTGCNCFGNARPAPVSWVELLRNAVLGAFAVAAIPAPHPTVPDVGAVATAIGLAILAAGVVRFAEAVR